MTTDATPILCRACGGPLEAASGLSFVCPYCGATDELPQDAAARARELARRLEARARRVAQLSGVDAALAAAFEQPGAFQRVLMPYLPVLVCIFAFGLVGPLATLSSVPDEARGEVLASVIRSLGIPLGIPISLLVLLYAGRRLYRRHLRGTLQARPPRTPGSRPRCRCCAAELPRGDGPLLRCDFCRTHNLLSADALAFRAELVAADERSYRAHLAEVARTTGKLGLRLDRWFAALCPLGLLAGYALFWLAVGLFR